MKLKNIFLTALATLFPFSSAFAEKDVLNAGDTSWLFISTALEITF